MNRLLLGLCRRPVHSLRVLRPIAKVSLSANIVPFNLPDVGEAIMTVIVKEWLVKPGDTIAMGDPVCEVQSDKSAATIYCPYDGVVHELMYEVDDVAEKDKPLLTIEVADGDSTGPDVTVTPSDEVATETEELSVPAAKKSGSGDKVLATPVVRKMAKDNNVELSLIKGTGKDGRVLKEDILNYLQSKEGPPAIKEPIAPPIAPPTASPTDRVESIKGFKMIMVRTMTASGQIPQFGYSDEVIMDEAMNVRSQIMDTMRDRGIKFSYMPLLIKAVSLALKEYPLLNCHVDTNCTNLIYKSDHNIGVAMDTKQGLVVPNIKQVQNKSIIDIAAELNRIHELGLSGNLSPNDVVGGTFSLSNIGAVGGTYTRPLILPPEVCIGAFGKIQVVPRFDSKGNVVKTSVMYVSWSADHRVIDGATVARFSNSWKFHLENPITMIANLI